MSTTCDSGTASGGQEPIVGVAASGTLIEREFEVDPRLAVEKRIVWIKVAEGNHPVDPWKQREIDELRSDGGQEIADLIEPCAHANEPDPFDRGFEKLEALPSGFAECLMVEQGNCVYGAWFLRNATEEQFRDVEEQLAEYLDCPAQRPNSHDRHFMSRVSCHPDEFTEDDIWSLEDLTAFEFTDFQHPALISSVCRRKYTGPPIDVGELVRRASYWVDCPGWLKMMLHDCGYSQQQAIDKLESYLCNDHPFYQGIDPDDRKKIQDQTIKRTIEFIEEDYEYVFREGRRVPAKQLVRDDDRKSCLAKDVRTSIELRVLNGTALNKLDLSEGIHETNLTFCDPPLSEDEVGQIVADALKLPAIIVSNVPDRWIARQSAEALHRANCPPQLFLRDGRLCRVERDEKGKPGVRTVDKDVLQEEMGRAANYYKKLKNGNLIHVPPPERTARGILASESCRLPFPPLESIVQAPFIRQDGTIVTAAGYDSQSKVYHFPSDDLDSIHVPMFPSERERNEAVATIGELYVDFPFKDAASRATGWAALFTPFIRAAVPVVPMFTFSATQAGTGKGLLTSAISVISSGRPDAKQTVPGTEDEMRKRITSLLLVGTSHIVFDNLESRLDSASLAAVITSPDWTDRKLGVNQQVRVPNVATWFLTGNNIQLGGDLPRRTVWCHLDAKLAKPWQRTEFKHPNLLEWAQANRKRLVTAVLTLVRAWFAAGKPEAKCRVLGSFEPWCRMIGGILQHAGIDGFLENFDQMYDEADTEAACWERLLEWVHEFRETTKDHDLGNPLPPFSVADLHDALKLAIGNKQVELPEPLVHAMNHREVVSQTKSVSHCLRKFTGRRFGRFRIEKAGYDTHLKVSLWKLVRS